MEYRICIVTCSNFDESKTLCLHRLIILCRKENVVEFGKYDVLQN